MKRSLIIFVIVLFIFILILAFEIFLAAKGEREDFKNPSNQPRFFGESGEEITYLILGDSTTAGQGGDYEKGIAVSTAKYLAQNKKVTMMNFSISGATIQNIREEQLNKALEYMPDIVLISAGSNDVTHLSSVQNTQENLDEILNKLIEKNCNVKIILTGSADLGSVPRFLQPLRWIAGVRVNQINNNVFYPTVDKRGLTLAPIARETGPAFRKNRSLFYSDNFHPNDEGYKLWIDVINKALDEAEEKQKVECVIPGERESLIVN